MDSKGNIVQVEEVEKANNPTTEKQYKVTNPKTGLTMTMYESELKSKFEALTEDQAKMLMGKSRKERRQWLRDHKMKKAKRV